MSLVTTITDFGDLAVALPLTILILLWLLMSRSPRGATWWALAVILVMGGTAILKVLFFACPPVPELRSPSGHTALATLVYGGLAVVTAADGKRREQVLISAVTALFVVGIAVSRILVHAHTKLETAFGLAIGLTALAIFARGYLSGRRAELAIRRLLCVAAIVLVCLHGQQLRAEEFLHSLAAYLHWAMPGCSETS